MQYARYLRYLVSTYSLKGVIQLNGPIHEERRSPITEKRPIVEDHLASNVIYHSSTL